MVQEFVMKSLFVAPDCYVLKLVHDSAFLRLGQSTLQLDCSEADN